jgi:hypothetical protein
MWGWGMLSLHHCLVFVEMQCLCAKKSKENLKPFDIMPPIRYPTISKIFHFCNKVLNQLGFD